MSNTFENFDEIQAFLESQGGAFTTKDPIDVEDTEVLFSKEELEPAVKRQSTFSYDSYKAPKDRSGSTYASAYTPKTPAPISYSVRKMTDEDYMKATAEAWFLQEYPGKEPTVAVTPDGSKVFVGTEDTKSFWFTKDELIAHQAQTQASILETIAALMDTEVPHNVRTHKWYKAVQRMLTDAMTFPNLPSK